MRIRSLGWAGFEIETSGARLLIDPLGDPAAWAYFREAAVGHTVPPSGPAVAALVTHLHRDHADAAALVAGLEVGAPVLCPAPAEGEGLEVIALAEAEHELGESGLDVRRVTAGDSFTLGPFTATALPASDGTGDPQVSWLVEAGDVRILHAGDTLWHGQWWNFRLRHGAIDLALLPANGPVLDFPHRQPPSSVPAAMSPEQAVEAAHVLRARRLVPMHFGTFEHETLYRERRDVAEAVRTTADERGVDVTFLEPGEAIDLEPAPAAA